MTITVFYNPACSKSRASVEYLKSKGIVPHIREYLCVLPNLGDLKSIQKRLQLPARAMLRVGEQAFRDCYSHIDINDDEAVLNAINEQPILLERPILIYGEMAVIGRSTENIDKLFSQ